MYLIDPLWRGHAWWTATTSGDSLARGYCSLANYSTSTALDGSFTDPHGGSDTLGTAPEALAIKTNEWMNGTINHALYIDSECTTGTVFPAPNGSAALLCSTLGASSTNRPPNGSLFFLDYTDAQINAMTLPAWQKPLVRAMAHYGGYQGDTTGTGASSVAITRVQSGEAYRLAGVTDPLFGPNWNNGWLASQGIQCVGPGDADGSICRYQPMNFLANIPNLVGPNCPTSTCGVAQHIHIADQCVPEGLAGVSGGCP